MVCGHGLKAFRGQKLNQAIAKVGFIINYKNGWSNLFHVVKFPRNPHRVLLNYEKDVNNPSRERVLKNY